MELILWRHAEAEEEGPGKPDAARQLTTAGRQQAQRTARWLARHLPANTEIIVSPATRTQQTVDPLGRRFRTEKSIASGASPEAVLAAAGWPDSPHPVLVVGHQPTLGQVAAMLLTGEPDYWTVGKGNVWWLASDEEGTWIRAVVPPELAG